MLKRFSIENFSSFQSESTLDLTAGRTEVNSNHVVDFNKTKVLKSAVIYGANASGKSNLIKALDYGQKIILEGIDSVNTHKKYFRLDEESAKKPTSFEYELEINSEFFSYGFKLTFATRKVEEEWLYCISKAKPEKIFERSRESVTLGKRLQSDQVKHRFNIYIDDMKNQVDQLFLSEIAGKGLELDEAQVINDVFQWFKKKLLIIYPSSTYNGIPSLCENNKLSTLFRKYLNEFDTGIINIETIEEDFEKSLKDFSDEVKKGIESNLLDSNAKVTITTNHGELLTIYKDNTGELKVQKIGLLHSKEFKEVFDLKDESDGTRRLFDLIPLIGIFSQDHTIIIDEFDRSLHPKLTKNFFELFYKLNVSKTQLIITTHESTLLDLDLVRRDEIWFVEKNKYGSSKIFSLNQFKARYDSKIEKAYLLGRYGAIPIFKTFNEISVDC
ncbi:MAG: AAA family ATPase [Mariprofundaceae bacterium]|nr:AAA family ATPase [Mariprofundaceae bacterium]